MKLAVFLFCLVGVALANHPFDLQNPSPHEDGTYNFPHKDANEETDSQPGEKQPDEHEAHRHHDKNASSDSPGVDDPGYGANGASDSKIPADTTEGENENKDNVNSDYDDCYNKKPTNDAKEAKPPVIHVHGTPMRFPIGFFDPRFPGFQIVEPNKQDKAATTGNNAVKADDQKKPNTVIYLQPIIPNSNFQLHTYPIQYSSSVVYPVVYVFSYQNGPQNFGYQYSY